MNLWHKKTKYLDYVLIGWVWPHAFGREIILQVLMISENNQTGSSGVRWLTGHVMIDRSCDDWQVVKRANFLPFFTSDVLWTSMKYNLNIQIYIFCTAEDMLITCCFLWPIVAVRSCVVPPPSALIDRGVYWCKGAGPAFIFLRQSSMCHLLEKNIKRKAIFYGHDLILLVLMILHLIPLVFHMKHTQLFLYKYLKLTTHFRYLYFTWVFPSLVSSLIFVHVSFLLFTCPCLLSCVLSSFPSTPYILICIYTLVSSFASSLAYSPISPIVFPPCLIS